MFLSTRLTTRLAAAAILGCCLTLTALAAPPDGKGNGNGGGGGGGGDDPPPPPPVSYTVVWLGDGIQQARVRDVNSGGFAVGSIYEGTDRREVIYDVYSNQVVCDLDILLSGQLNGWRVQRAMEINSAGRILGVLEDESGGTSTVFVFDFYDVFFNGVEPNIRIVPVADITTGEGGSLSEDGVVQWTITFTPTTGDWFQQMFVWDPDYPDQEAPEAVEWLPAELGGGAGINSEPDRVVVGARGTGVWRYFLASGQYEFLADSGRGPARVNDFGEVAASTRFGLSKRQKFAVPQIYRDGLGWQPLTTEPGEVESINNAGQVCGTGTTVFVYDPVDGYWSMDDLIAGDTSDPNVAQWFADDNNPGGMSEVEVGSDDYPIIIGQQVNTTVRGFALIPLASAP